MEFSENYLDKMLSSAIDYYQFNNISEQEIPLKLDSYESAVSIFQNCLRNEAHRTMTEKTTHHEPLLHAVNLDTEQPGIITKLDTHKSQVSIYTNHSLVPPEKKKKKKRYKSKEQLEEIAQQKYEKLQKKKSEQHQQYLLKKEEKEDQHNLKVATKKKKEADKQINKLDKEMNQFELERNDKEKKLESINQDPQQSQKYQKTVQRLQNSLLSLQQKETQKKEIKEQLNQDKDSYQDQISHLQEKKNIRKQHKQEQKEHQLQLKEERRLKRLEKEKIKQQQLQDSLEGKDEQHQQLSSNNTDIQELSDPHSEPVPKIKKKQRKISSLEPSEIMDELYDCLNSFKSDLLEDNASSSTPLSQISLYPSPIPFERHLSSLNLCNPNPVLLPSLLHGSNNFKDHHLKLIHGPPGTGKTYRLILELQKILEINNREKVLLCAPSNIGVINMYNRALSMGIHGCLVLSSNKIPDNFKLPEKPGKDNVIFTTISMRFGSILNKEKFSTVIIDEACQCQEAWTWGLLRNEVTQVILAGDPQQLPAQVSDLGKKYCYDRSLMTRLIQLGFNSELLSVQRRMHPDIAEFSNKYFYQGKLSSNYCPPSTNVPVPPLQIINVNGQECQRGTSFYNTLEVNKVLEIEQQLRKHFKEVIIISPYKEHCKALTDQNKDIQVHTIDSYQGKEAEAIILTTVRTGQQLGFWNDYRRLNVGMTRAKHALRIVGCLTAWSSSEGPLKDLVDFYKNKGKSSFIVS